MPDQDPPGRQKDYAYLDDWTSLAIVGSVLLAFLSIVGGGVYLIGAGHIATDFTVTGDISFTGTIPVGLIVMGVLGGLGWMVYIAFSDIYGRRRVENATDEVQTLTGDDDE